MSFLWPLWLWAGAAAAVPVVIHLLSRGRGRTVAIGTIRFLPTTRSHRLRKIRPSRLLRMLLRAALLACLALALAGPRYWTALPPAPEERWLLVDPALLIERDRLEVSAPDAYQLLDATDATERRLLAPGLPRLEGDVGDTAAPTDLWSLVAEADAIAPPGAAIEAFVLDRTEAFAGARPILSRPVEWRTVADSDANRWVQRAIPTAEGLDVTIGTSTADGTRFFSTAVSSAAPRAEGLVLSQRQSGDVLTLTDGGSRPDDDRTVVPPERPPFVVSIEADTDRSSDASEVLRAATAVAAYLDRPLALATETDRTADVAFGLGTATGGIVAPVRILDSDEGDPCRQATFVDALAEPWLRLRRCGGPTSESVRWRGAWGQPLLSVERSEADVTYRWHGRFDPAWSNVSEAGLPHLLLDLVAPKDASLNGAVSSESDRMAPAAGQSRPASADRPAPSAPSRIPERIAWVLVVALFLVDRLLVGRTS